MKKQPEKLTEIPTLIKQLGAEEFEKREQAEKRLKAFGDKALDDLKEAFGSTKDPEVKSRLERILEETNLNVIIRIDEIGKGTLQNQPHTLERLRAVASKVHRNHRLKKSVSPIRVVIQADDRVTALQ